MHQFGNKNKLCFIVALNAEDGLWPIDIWAKNVLLTHYDHWAYLQCFIFSLEVELNNLKLRKLDDVFFDHGPTTDDFHAEIYLSENEVDLSFELDNKMVKVSMQYNELIDLYTKVIVHLNKLEA